MELKSLFDVTKLPTKVLVVFSVITGFLLFSGNNTLSIIHLENIHEKYGPIIGLVFLLSGGIVIVNLLLWLIENRQRKINRKNFEQNSLNYLSTLTPHEKALFREFWIQQNRTIRAPIDDPTISNLLERDVIYITGTIMRGTIASISVDSFVWINLEPQHLDMSSTNLSGEEREFVMRNRPHWIETVRLLEGAFNFRG